MPGLETVPESKFARLWFSMTESERKLVRSFAGPPGIEDASRTEATKDLVIVTDYPTHGALRTNMYKSFRLSGLHSVWDDFVTDANSEAITGTLDPVDQCPGLYMEDQIPAVIERLAVSMLEARVKGTGTVFPTITQSHECYPRWSNAVATLNGSQSIPADAVDAHPPSCAFIKRCTSCAGITSTTR